MTEERERELMAEIARLERVNQALMVRIERDLDQQPGGLVLLQSEMGLETRVRERTAGLESSLRQLEQSHATLREASATALNDCREKGERLAGMAHDVRLPLCGIRSITQLLVTHDLPAALRGPLGSIHRSVDALIVALQEPSEPDPQASPARAGSPRAALFVREVVEDALEIGACCAEGRDVEVTAAVGSEVPESVVGDGARVRQVLTHLIGSAAMLTARGHVHLTARTLLREQDGVTLRFDVRDTGIGGFLEPEPSVQLAGEAAMSLSSVRRQVEAMGGQFGTNSPVEGGTHAWFTLPFGVDVEGQSALGSRPLLSETVLLTSISPLLQESLIAILETAGAKVVTVARSEDLAASAAAAARVWLVDEETGLREQGELLEAAKRGGVPGVKRVLLRRPFRAPTAVGGFAAELFKPLRAGSVVATVAELSRRPTGDLEPPVARPPVETFAAVTNVRSGASRPDPAFATLSPTPRRLSSSPRMDALAAAARQAPDASSHRAAGVGDVVLDMAAVEQLRSLRRPGRPSVLFPIICGFIESAPKELALLERALDQGEWRDACNRAHGLKSSAAQLGATQLADALDAVEQYGREPRAHDGSQVIQRMKRETTRAIDALEELRRSENSDEVSRAE